ncbi:hypothetical protein PRIPAC_91227, partial [Pristionchus pacificus]|uniref:Uncharacterized protein n=1 Tax=Pristionchus pacificus TaxID=54126 RepID=A0A2A6B7D3_PRIPA
SGKCTHVGRGAHADDDGPAEQDGHPEDEDVVRVLLHVRVHRRVACSSRATFTRMPHAMQFSTRRQFVTMNWTAVGVAIRGEQERAPMEQLFANLQRAGLFPASTEILIVVDAADHSGSAGSALNTLLVLVSVFPRKSSN